MAAPTGSERLATASVWQYQIAVSSLQCKWCSLTYLVLYKFIDSGFLISKWQGTASSWQGLGPAWPALGYATASQKCLTHGYIWSSLLSEAPPPEHKADKHRKFVRRRDRALALILLSIKPLLLYLVRDPETTIIVWQKLVNQF